MHANGLGDVAMEAGIALGRQPSTTVTLVYRGTGFRRGKSRNIDEIRRMSESSRLSLLFESEVDAITADTVVLRSASGRRAIPYDAVLVMIGTIPPWNTLRAAGVRTHEDAQGDRMPEPPVQGDVRPA